MGDRSDFAKALGSVASGLFVVTAGTGDKATGLLASFVQQGGFEPPVVMVAVKKGRSVEDLIRGHGSFCVSVLHDGSKALLGHFARGFEPGEPAFGGVAHAWDETGVPYLTEALANLSCKLVGESTWSDHVVFCGEVTAGSHLGEGEPMIHVRKNGLGY